MTSQASDFATEEEIAAIDVEIAREMLLTEEQKLAVKRIVEEPVSIITGPAGSGKTQCLRMALREVEGESVLCCAPTAKAAKRMTELTGFPSATIHRAIGAQGPGSPDLANEDNPLSFDLIVVDETSMVDDDLLSRLLRAVAPGTRIVFVGDVNQIPPVSAGHPFADLIESGLIPVTYLTRNFRAEAGSWVAENAIHIIEGELDRKPTPSFKMMVVSSAEDLTLHVSSVLRKAKRKDLQIISPQYAGPGGIDELNRAAQDIVNREQEGIGIEIMNATAFIGDPVRATRNDYQLDTFNGDIGVIVDSSGDTVEVSFDGRVRVLPRTYVETMRLAYTMSVHSVQGSEYPWVIVVCHSQHSHMWNRQLLYTAVTRAQEGVIIVGDHAGIAQALATNGHERSTVLGYLMQEDADGDVA